MNTTDTTTAFALCAQLPLNPTQIVRLILELVEKSGGLQQRGTEHLMEHCRKVIRLGIEANKRQEQTVPFLHAYEETLQAKAHRSKLTLRDIRYYMRRLMRETPGLSSRPIRDITANECSAMLERVFISPSQRKKGRAILSGVFTVARKRGWCGENPIRLVDVPYVEEKEILPLTMPEIRRLLNTVKRPEYQRCAAALGVMLWAGVRPFEVRRMKWEDIDLQEGELVVKSRHSKTSGGRIIPLCPPLLKVLNAHRPKDESVPICPPGWEKVWQELRRTAGFREWTQDVLRHTYASYHAKKYRNLFELQMVMGHASTKLLRERYVNLRGISKRDAERFWLPS